MKGLNKNKAALAALLAGTGLAGAGHAAEILVTGNISTSTTWTANNTYNLQQQVYVLPGATLTIEAGTVVASTTNIGGSLAVCKGAQIFVLGTSDKPVIMTSKADVATWTGGNPKTGTWREAVNEWGNLTVMGGAYISSNNHGGATTNTPAPSASNVAPMEGLIADFPGDTKVLYGGGNDDDDSGTIKYVSLRYGGKVVALNNELNGLSMGGIGRETTVNHVDIMNNVDDGIETWGGTVNYKDLSIWNVGDDCFDIDEGWRGKAEFALLVNGYSIDAAQGSGVGDHGCEMDGAEDSDWQPVTTGNLYNFTIIMQPLNTRGTTAWRDNCRMQFHNSIFMDGGGEVVKFDNTDGDGAHGYGFNGTLSWNDTWTTPFSTLSTINPFPSDPGSHYLAQTSGNLIEIVDSVFFRNLAANAYTEANLHNVFAAGNDNVITPGSADADMPIRKLVRGAPVVKGGKTELPVVSLDPRPANAALTVVPAAPADGFFTPAPYRGAFAPDQSWNVGWTAEDAYGFLAAVPWVDGGYALAGVNGDPELVGSGPLTASSVNALTLTNAKPSSLAELFVSLSSTPVPFKGGTLVPVPFLLTIPLATNGSGSVSLPFVWPNSIPAGTSLFVQFAVSDAAAVHGVSLSNSVKGIGQ